MKRSIIFMLLCTAASFCYAQKVKPADVPTPVKDAFAKLFPSVKNVAWSKENDSEFEAEFKNGGKELSANFDQTGKWIETETEIKKSELPAAVQATISK